MTRTPGGFGVRAFVGRGDGRRVRWRDVLAVASLLGVGWLCVILAGGSARVTTNWFYLPILLAAVLLGPLGTLVTALAAAVIAGPLTPSEVYPHVSEALSASL